jgi:hypothetical protein
MPENLVTEVSGIFVSEQTKKAVKKQPLKILV